MLGRDAMVVNTGGEKVFVEEVEEALRSHPGSRMPWLWAVRVTGSVKRSLASCSFDAVPS